MAWVRPKFECRLCYAAGVAGKVLGEKRAEDALQRDERAGMAAAEGVGLPPVRVGLQEYERSIEVTSRTLGRPAPGCPASYEERSQDNPAEP